MIKDKFLLARMADEDLRTPSHDAIMIWLQENIAEVCARLLTAEINAHLAGHTSRMESLPAEDHELLASHAGATRAMDSLVAFETIWEHPVPNRNAIVGFIDLLAEIGGQHLYVLHDEQEIKTEEGKNKFGRAIYKTEKRKCSDVIVGIDPLATIAFEVKTTIRSLGETIRQINTYRAYMRAGTRFCIVSPDDRFRAILESQGILFVKAPAVGDSGGQGGLF